MTDAFLTHFIKPEPNWWSEEQWCKWFKELKEVVSDSTNSKIVGHINSLTYPEHKHWTRWVWWYEDLKQIVLRSNGSETE